MSTSNPADPTPVVATSGEDKTAAILAYCTLIGFIVAIVLNSQKKTRIGAFHLRQALGLFLTGVAMGFIDIVLLFIPILGWLAIAVVWISLLVFLVIGLIAASKGEFKTVPVLGGHYQKWFGTAFE